MCKPCGLKYALNRKAIALSSQYKNEHVKQLWLGFANWLVDEGKALPALGPLPSYALVLNKVDRVVNESEVIRNAHLATALTADDMNRAGLLAEYLGRVGVLTSNNVERTAWSDEKRIASMVAELRHFKWAKDIQEYSVYLADAGRKVSPRTQRIYLRAAVALMEFVGADKVSQVTDENLTEFIRKKPGHRASLSAWLRFLSESRQITLKLPGKRQAKPITMKASVDEVAGLQQALTTESSPRAQMAFLAKLISVLYAVPLETVLRLGHSDITDKEGVISINLRGQWLDMDSRVAKWVRWLLIENSSSNQGYVFPGRRKGDAWSTTGVGYYLKSGARVPSSETS
jgi:hypothetical protein